METRLSCKNCGKNKLCVDTAYSKTITSEYKGMFDNVDTGTLDRKIININMRCLECGEEFDVEIQETKNLSKVTIRGI